tara:strand:- start:847 stop:1428 length:582 start_codon:yes stop_codon:yes gene_type:complete
MKNENLKDYILHLSNWIPKEIVDKTMEELPKQKWSPHLYRDTQSGKSESKNKNRELDCTYEGYSLTHDKDLHELIWKALYKYFIEDNKDKPYLTGWQGFSKIRFNRYRSNQIMSKHCDHIHDVFDGERKGIPIVSILGVLNDNYKGGEFIMFDDYNIKLKTGDLLLFPSVFLYPHKVEPVLEGERYSFVSWSW